MYTFPWTALGASSGEAFSTPLLTLAFVLASLAVPLAVLAIVLSALKYQKDSALERHTDGRELAVTALVAGVLFALPLLLNVFFWILTGELMDLGDIWP